MSTAVVPSRFSRDAERLATTYEELDLAQQQLAATSDALELAQRYLAERIERFNAMVKHLLESGWTVADLSESVGITPESIEDLSAIVSPASEPRGARRRRPR